MSETKIQPRQDSQLTAFERALLQQFSALASDCGTSLISSRDTAQALETLSQRFGSRVQQIETRMSAIEERLDAVTSALDTHNTSTESLVTQVNRLLDAQSK